MSSEQERQLREQLDEARFQTKALTWIAAFFCATSLLLLVLR